MIIKSFELDKIDLKINKIFLLYGENQGAKDELIQSIINQKKIPTFKYHENEVINNSEDFFNSILSKSFFDKEKIFIVKKITNKIYKIIDEIIEKNSDDIIILDAEILDRKSKLRNLFEKNKNLVCIPFYPDNEKTLNVITYKFLKEKNINLSQETINLITERANGSREHLFLELEKIDNLSLTKKKISFGDIAKLTNSGTEYKISELVDNCLAKNENKVLRSINDNNFNSEDNIIIIRTFLYKAKRLLKLKEDSTKEQNLDILISSHKPPIFWKEKGIVKMQMKIWSHQKILKLINQINKIELMLKKSPQISLYVLNNFILQNTSKINN
tara:strand:+ start:68 stop:1057 length:990 start_codon:yes stop_codon:yes gene_type:complete